VGAGQQNEVLWDGAHVHREVEPGFGAVRTQRKQTVECMASWETWVSSKSRDSELTHMKAALAALVSRLM
jgi:hypothetical protein